MLLTALVLALAVCVALAATLVQLVAARRQLAADTNLFSQFLEHGPFLAYLKDADGRYAYENQATREHVARVIPGTTSTLGRTDRELFSNTVGTLYVDHDRTVVEQGQPSHFAEMSVDSDGTVRHWSSIKFLCHDDRGRSCIAGISIDVTALRQARTEARSSEERHSLALEAGRMGTFTLDLASRMLVTSSLFATLHGRPETSTRLCIEESLAEVHPDDHGLIFEAIHAAVAGQAPSRITYRVVLPDDSIRWVEIMGRVFADEDGRPTVVHGVGFDVTEQREAYDELAHRKAMLRRLIEVQENERQTLCHELHDGMMQYAIGAKMLLEAARDQSESPAQTERLESVLDCLTRGITEGRQVIRGVRSAVLDDLGLAAAIQDLADQMTTLGIDVTLRIDEGVDAMPPDLRTTIYRVVQESLANVRKHAATSHASVEVCRTCDEVLVRVVDDGQGFDVEEARKRGFGLVGMTERVRLAGGSCTIESRPGAGARIEARLPIPAASGAEAAQPRAFQAT